MPKDPAFLFYYRDFSHGTRKMTFEEKGAYIELLCEQADCGHLSLDDIKRTLGIQITIWERICSKFCIDCNGLYYNEVLETHLKIRQKYVISRKNNLKKTHMHSHMSKHMANANAIESEDIKKGKTFKKPAVEEVVAYCLERKNKIVAQAFLDFYESKGWMIGNSKMKDWKAAIRTWERRHQEVSKKQTQQTVPDYEQSKKYLASLENNC